MLTGAPCCSYVGVDIGGTRLKLGVVSEAGEVSRVENVPTPGSREDIYDAIKQYVAQVDGPVAGVGMSMPGVIDATGYSITAGAIKPLIHRPIKKELSEWLGLPVFVGNDGRCATVAEGWVGVAQRFTDYVLFTLGTAIGGGIVLDGKLRDGLGGLAGEFGVALVDIPISDYSKHSFARHASTVAGLCLRYSEQVGEQILDAREIYRRADAGDKLAQRCIGDFYQAVAVMCINAAVTLAPEALILGGGISANQTAMSEIKDRYQRIISEYHTLGMVRMPKLLIATCRNDAGMIGAVRRLILANNK